MVLGIRCTVTFTEQFWDRHRDVGLTVYPGKDHLPSEKISHDDIQLTSGGAFSQTGLCAAAKSIVVDRRPARHWIISPTRLGATHSDTTVVDRRD